MRILAGLTVLGLCASAYLAPAYQRERPGSLPRVEFVDEPAERAARGERERALGVALAGYEDLSAEDPADLEALRARIRVGLLIGAVALGQPGLHELVRVQTDAYLARRAELDPDGSFIRGVLEEWVEQRLHFDWTHRQGFYARVSTAIFLAARDDPRGHDMLMTLVKKGEFYTEFFPYARRLHPGWPAVAPLVRHYLEQGGLAARVEAGVTLLDYKILFGTGQDLWERFGEDIRAAVREMRHRVRTLRQDPETRGSGETAILGLLMLAALGFPEEGKAVERATRRAYLQHADLVFHVGHIWTGRRMFVPQSPEYKRLDPTAQTYYYRAVAHRAALLTRGLAPGTDEELDDCLRLLVAGFDGPYSGIRSLSLQVLAALVPEKRPELIRRAIDERNILSITAAALADRLDDPLAVLLPPLQSPEPDYSALAAVTLLDRGDTRPLQR
ncbi:MAG: hypothetical protein ACYTEZ_00665 [Planctomycetota bacterium]|jgi:hypothetical protein